MPTNPSAPVIHPTELRIARILLSSSAPHRAMNLFSRAITSMPKDLWIRTGKGEGCASEVGPAIRRTIEAAPNARAGEPTA